MNTATPHLIDFKFATVKALSLHLQHAKEAALIEELNRRLKGSGGVYFGEPTVLDFSAWTEEEFQSFDGNLKKMVSQLIKSGLNPVELKVRFNHWEDQAEDLGLRFNLLTSDVDTPAAKAQTLPHSADSDQKVESVHAEAQQTRDALHSDKSPERKTMVVDQSVRSGQRIYAQGADLIVMGQVSAGAEVIADGNVHVYGVLRGRALAGAAGDAQARILSTCFEPELVSIAGYYLTFEADYPEGIRSNPTLVYLEEGETSAEVRLKAINIR